MTLPDSDYKLAQSKKLRFQVSTKEGKGKRWSVYKCDLDLLEAFSTASSITDEAVEIGIWLIGPSEEGNYLYWTNSHPDVFNTTILERGNHANSKSNNGSA